MIKTLFATALLSFSVGAKSIDHREAATNNRLTINGCYNFKDVIDDLSSIDDGRYEIVFENYVNNVSQNLQIVPIHRSSETSTIWYCDSIQFDKSDYNVELTFHVYNYAYSHGVDWIYNFNSGDDISDFSSSSYDLIFEVRQSYVLLDEETQLFNALFTSEDNIYTISYSGFYSFRNNLSTMNNKFAVFGYSIFNQQTYSFMFNYGDGVHTDTASGIYMSYYSLYDENYSNYEGYAIESFAFPLNRNYVESSQILFNNVKMSQTSYQRLASYGAFAYVRDTSYDDADWKDLLFSVVDSPIYMISRLLNFEIFGINLYIALAGLLTIVVIVFCVRKFL